MLDSDRVQSSWGPQVCWIFLDVSGKHPNPKPLLLCTTAGSHPLALHSKPKTEKAKKFVCLRYSSRVSLSWPLLWPRVSCLLTVYVPRLLHRKSEARLGDYMTTWKRSMAWTLSALRNIECCLDYVCSHGSWVILNLDSGFVSCQCSCLRFSSGCIAKYGISWCDGLTAREIEGLDLMYHMTPVPWLRFIQQNLRFRSYSILFRKNMRIFTCEL